MLHLTANLTGCITLLVAPSLNTLAVGILKTVNLIRTN